jgi:hypothetical protein
VDPHKPPKIIGDPKDNINVRALEVSILLGCVGEQKPFEGLTAFSVASKKIQSTLLGRIGPEG